MTTANEAWIKSLEGTLINGTEVEVRGFKTLEVLNQSITFDMNYPICYNYQRKLSYKFMAAEAYWITSGGLLTEEITPYNKHISQFSDDKVIFNGAYGPMFISQVEYVVNSLLNDSNSRQAVMTIWVPNPIKSKDYRCTVSLIFYIRNHKLHTTVTMRSNDLILGRPYDMFNFTIMTLRVLTRINEELQYQCDIIGLGEMTLNTVSAHIYETQIEWANSIVEHDKQEGNMVTEAVPLRCTKSWRSVVQSLLLTMGEHSYKNDQIGRWRIRP
jgi:thymidylate synthase